MESRTNRAPRIIKEATTINPQSPSLRESIFEHADLRGLDLSLFDLSYCTFHNCDLRGTKLPARALGSGALDFSTSRRDLGDPALPGWTLLHGAYLVPKQSYIQDGSDGDSWPFASGSSD